MNKPRVSRPAKPAKSDRPLVHQTSPGSLDLVGYTVMPRGGTENLTWKQECELMDVALLANDYDRLKCFVDKKVLSDQEKAKRYDELQSWHWWLERRAKNNGGKIPKAHLKTFMQGIKEYFEPYPEEE